MGTTPNQTEHIWTYELGTQFLLDLETINRPEKDHYEVTKVRGTNTTGIKKQNIAIYLNLDEQDKMSILLVSKKIMTEFCFFGSEHICVPTTKF